MLSDFNTTAGDKAIKKPPSSNIALLLCIGEIFLMMGLSFLGPILPKFVTVLGVPHHQIGMAIGLTVTAFGAARVVTSIPAGILAQRLGRRVLLVGAPLLVFVSAVGLGFTTDYWQLIVWRLLQGAAAAGYSVAALIMLGEISTPANRGLYISFFWTAALIGASIGPTFGGFIGEYLGYRAAFFCYSSIALSAAVWGYFFIPETARIKQTTAPAKASAASKADQDNYYFLKNHNFILITLVSLCTLITVGGTQNTMVPLWGYEKLSLSESQLGLALTAIAIMQVLFSPVGGRLSDQWGRKKMIVPGGIITSLGLIMFVHSGSFFIFVFSALVVGLGRGIGASVAATYVSDLALEGNYERIIATYRAMSDLGWVIGPLLCGYLKDTAGLRPPFYLTAGMLLVMVLLFGKYGREYHGQKNNAVVLPSYKTD